MLTQGTKYAIRACIYLAGRGDEAVLSREIAAAVDVPGQYLAKVLQGLARAGILASTKGRGGGFRLAVPAAEVSLLRIVRAVEPGNQQERCVLGLPTCSDRHACALHDRWKGPRSTFLTALEETHLTDVRAMSAADEDSGDP